MNKSFSENFDWKISPFDKISQFYQSEHSCDSYLSLTHMTQNLSQISESNIQKNPTQDGDEAEIGLTSGSKGAIDLKKLKEYLQSESSKKVGRFFILAQHFGVFFGDAGRLRKLGWLEQG